MTKGKIVPTAILAAAAAAAMAFSNGVHIVAPAAWVGTTLLLRLTRSGSRWTGLALGFLLFLGVWIFSWAEVLRLHGVELIVSALVLAGIGFLPYAADRWLARRLAPLAGSLVFPCATVAIEYFFTRISPFGSWGMIAYSQTGLLPLAQLAAFTGMLGITFLVCWFAAIANLVWEERAALARWRPAAALFALVMVLVLAGGALRLAAAPAPAASLRVAALLPAYENDRNYDRALAPELQDRLFARAGEAARAGARIIAWPEDSFFILEREEPALAARAAAFARGAHAWLALAYGARTGETGLRYRNRFLLVDPEGRLAFHYAKSFPVPGYEQRNMVPGDGRLAWAAAPFGRIAGAICFDGDHRSMMGQLGNAADLLLLPSDDWPAIVDLHARMARMRAIEQGAPVLRPTMNGRTIIVDAVGHQLGALDSAGHGGEMLLADLPVGARPTLYARIGDVFAWLCIAALLLVALFALRRRAPAHEAA